MKELYEIKVGNSGSQFLCNKYIGFSDMYKEWGGGWCLEVFFAHKRGVVEDSSTHKWARKVREKFKTFMFNEYRDEKYLIVEKNLYYIKNKKIHFLREL